LYGILQQVTKHKGAKKKSGSRGFPLVKRVAHDAFISARRTKKPTGPPENIIFLILSLFTKFFVYAILAV
jgi:hypothetical protein